jgi:YHS domain-containing protein
VTTRYNSTITAAALLTLGAILTLAHDFAGAASRQADHGRPINAMCPIGKEPIQAGAATIEYDGHVLGFCCPACGKAFLAWDQKRRDEFVTLALAEKEPGHERHGGAPAATAPQLEAEAAPAASYPYPLETCPVTGKRLGSMGDPIVRTYDGREVRLCCVGCVDRFEADRATYWKQIDEQIVETQRMHYPIDSCIVGESELGSMGDPVDLVHRNRLIRFCCAGCEPAFEAETADYLAALDEAVIRKQREGYPLTTCVVTGEKLGSMGEPVDHVYANRLVRFCCAGCVKGFEEDPAKFLAKLDKAYTDAQRAAYPIGARWASRSRSSRATAWSASAARAACLPSRRTPPST